MINNYQFLFEKEREKNQKQADRIKHLEKEIEQVHIENVILSDERSIIASIITMATDSLDPDQFLQLEKIVDRLSKNRGVDYVNPNAEIERLKAENDMFIEKIKSKNIEIKRLYRNLEVTNQANDRSNAKNKYLQEQNTEMSWTINPDRMGK